jgi:hypothetical protein
MALAATHPTGAVGWGAAVWWSRVAQPALHTGSPDDQLLPLQERTPPRHARPPKELACSGLLVRHVPQQPAQRRRRFGDDRPVSPRPTALLAWGSERLAAHGRPAVLLSWDNASWHISQEVRPWLRQHHHRVKQTGPGVRILACRLPRKSPWLQPIAPKWVPGQRAIVAPERWRSAQEIVERVSAYDGCPDEVHLPIAEKAA